MPANLCLLPSFPKPSLEADGVHLNPYSGLEYIMYLFDAPQAALDRSFMPPEVRVSHLAEDHRSLADRVLVLEREQARIVKKNDLESAIRSEFDDFQENVANETFFMVQGLPVLTKLDSKEWQVRAQADVNRIITDMGLDIKVDYVQNMTGRGKDARVLYKCRAPNVEASRTVRNKFSSYFRGGQDSRPSSLASISIRNCLTSATLGRIAIMQLLAKRYRESNPGSRTQVIGFESRPILKLTPPSGVSDRRVQTYTFVDAVSKLPTNFAPDEVDDLMRRISNRLYPQLKELFVVLSPDMVKKDKSVFKKRSSAKSSTRTSSGSDSSSFRTPEGDSRKRGTSSPSTAPASKK